MFIKKTKITQLIKKEREKERQSCEKENARTVKNLKNDLDSKYTDIIKQLKADHKKEILGLKNEIKALRSEIEKNHSTYIEVRMREKGLQELSSEMEEEISKMLTRVHESIQPFYRTMSKVETTKRKSDRKHEKIERVFSIVS